jgi:hypothetical protein
MSLITSRPLNPINPITQFIASKFLGDKNLFKQNVWKITVINRPIKKLDPIKDI